MVYLRLGYGLKISNNLPTLTAGWLRLAANFPPRIFHSRLHDQSVIGNRQSAEAFAENKALYRFTIKSHSQWAVTPLASLPRRGFVFEGASNEAARKSVAEGH